MTPSPTAILNRQGGIDGKGWAKLDPAEWSDNVVRVVAYARAVGEALLGFEPTVEIANDPRMPAAATWGGRTLSFNRGRLGERWFAEVGEPTDEILLHEFAHARVQDHLSAEFADEVARLGAKFVRLVIARPDVFADWRPVAV